MSNQPFTSKAPIVRSKLKRYSDEERNIYFEGWKKSGLSMSQYCRDKEVSVSTLSKWAGTQNNSKPEFKPVTLTSTMPCNQNIMVEIVVDNRIKMRLPSTADVSMIVNIVRGLMPCN